MFCKFCGAELADDAKFCNVCGKKLDGTANEEVLENNNVSGQKEENPLFAKIVKILKMCFAGIALLTSFLVIIQAFTPTYVLSTSGEYASLADMPQLPSEVTISSFFNMMAYSEQTTAAFEIGKSVYVLPLLLMVAALIIAIVAFCIGIFNWIRTLSTGAKSKKNGYRSFGLVVLSFLFMIVASGLALSSYEETASGYGLTLSQYFKYSMSGLTTFIIVLITIAFLISVAVNVLSKLNKENFVTLIVKNAGRFLNFLFLLIIAFLIIPGFAALNAAEDGNTLDVLFSLPTFFSIGCENVITQSGSEEQVLLFGSICIAAVIYVGLTIVIGLTGYRLFKKDDENSPKASIALPIVLFVFLLCYYGMCSSIISDPIVIEGAALYEYPYQVSGSIIGALVLTFILIATNITWTVLAKVKKDKADSNNDLTL